MTDVKDVAAPASASDASVRGASDLAAVAPPAPSTAAAPSRGDSDDDDDDDDNSYNENDDYDDDEEDKSMYHLHDLVEQGAIDALRALLPLKAPPVAPDSDATARASRSAMHVMATESLLLEKDDMGCLPLHIAILHQQKDCARHVLAYSEALTTAMLRIKCGDLGTPLVHLILRVGALNAAFATDLIAELFGDDGSSSSRSNATETLAATWSDDVKAHLLEKLVAKDEEGNSVFHLCGMYDLTECLRILTAFFIRQTELYEEEEERSPSKKNKNVSSLGLLLEKANRVGFRPLHAAMKFQSRGVADMLVRTFRVNVNSTTTLQHTPAHIAALAGFTAGIALLQTAAADMTLTDSHGATPLDLAKTARFTAIEQLLTGKAAESKAKSSDSKSSTTKFYYHPEALQHLPLAYHRRGADMEPPPENPERIATLVDPTIGILRSREFAHVPWDYDIARADIADVLRVHEFHYVDKLQTHCAGLGGGSESVETVENDTGKTFTLDPDTALSLRSYDAATRAAGAVCKAVDDVVSGACVTAFCVVRPPGHHAGPVGKVVCANDPEGSHGFCLLNNVAIGAAYARAHYKHKGIDRIAILDFDVHHGNGTEEIVRQLVPRTQELEYATPYGAGKQVVQQYKPWRSADDLDHVFFGSVQGYGPKDPEHAHEHTDPEQQPAWFYPGSGATTDGPQIWNVGLPFCHDGASAARLHWRSAFRDVVLRKLAAFRPDLIFLSAGFDAHRRESVNWGYGALLEQDYEWLVHHVKRVAHASCHGRVVSVLEGGYNFHGRIVSPFARSVAAHARALVHLSQAPWDDQEIALEAAHERALLATYSKSSSSSAADGVHAVSVSSKKRADGAKTTSGGSDESVPLAVSRSKRARKDVDYVALAEAMAQQQQ